MAASAPGVTIEMALRDAPAIRGKEAKKTHHVTQHNRDGVM